MKGATALAVLSVACGLGTFPAKAQTGAQTDWDMRRDANARLKVAFTAFDSGLAVAARCTDGVYEVVMAGLPPASGNADSRTLRIGFQGQPLQEQTWFVASDRSVAVSGLPAPFARELRAGGRLDIVVPAGGEGGANIRYVVELPTSALAIDETLGACGRPLSDPRDALLPDVQADGTVKGRVWTRPPRLQYPLTDALSGFVTLSCLGTASGAIEQCVVEAEYPPRQGFGRAAQRAAERARLEPSVDGKADMIVFRSTFYTDGYQSGRRQETPTGSRLAVPSPDG